jgi:hypothetical protein
MPVAILRTFQRGISILASLPASVPLGVAGFVCIPQTMFIINITPWVDIGRFPDQNFTLILLLCQAIPTLVLSSWAIGVLINRTAHSWYAERKGKNSISGIIFPSFKASQEHDFLWPMVGYSCISIACILATGGFAKFWDDGLSVSFAPEAIIMVLGNLLAWVTILYFYATVILAAPIIVLHRKGVMSAVRASYKLSKDEATRWELFSLIILLLVIGAILDSLFELVIVNGVFGNVSNKAFAYCFHFDLLLVIMLPLFSRCVVQTSYIVRSVILHLT